jgi:parvulin-like peptidyl-prolyl isomerase
MSETERGSVSALRWLIVGAIAGAALAAATLVRGGAPNASGAATGIPSEAVAMVNGRPVTRDALARFTGALARERGRLELDAAEQRRILDRLIDEELLLQHGIALGLDRSEPSARRAIVSAVIDTLTTAEMRDPDRAELEAFYRDYGKSLARAGAVQVELAFVPVGAIAEGDAKQRGVEIARRARAGELLAALAATLGQPLEPPLPAGPTTFDALRDRFGNVVVQALAGLAPGEISDPVRAMDGYWVTRLVAREPDAVPPLDDVIDVVQQAWVQHEHDALLTREIERLRKQADLTITDATLAGAR